MWHEMSSDNNYIYLFIFITISHNYNFFLKIFLMWNITIYFIEICNKFNYVFNDLFVILFAQQLIYYFTVIVLKQIFKTYSWLIQNFN